MEKRFYSGVADLAFNEKSGAVLAVSRRQSDITRWNMGVDGRASRCPARTTIATKSTISWASSACAPARGPRPTWCSNTATARKHWSATSSAKPAGTTTMRRAASASTSTTSSRAGAIRCRPAGTARSATAYRSATSWSLSSPGPAAIYGGRLRQGTEAAGQLDPQRPRRPGSGAHRRNHAHPLRRPGMAAGAGRVRTLPAIAFLPSRLRQQGRLPGLQQGPLPARHRGRELRQRQRVSVRPHRMGTAGPGRRRAL